MSVWMREHKKNDKKTAELRIKHIYCNENLYNKKVVFSMHNSSKDIGQELVCTLNGYLN